MPDEDVKKFIYQEIANATVKILVANEFRGSGVFISSDYVLTAYHCIGEYPPKITIEARFGERFFNAELDKAKSLKHPYYDIAVLKIYTKATHYLPLGTISTQNVTDEIVATGYPAGDKPEHDKVGFFFSKISQIRTDNKIQIPDAIKGRGQSGGPIYHHEMKRVIGLATEGYKLDVIMDVGLATRFDALFQNWPELEIINNKVAKAWDERLLELGGKPINTTSTKKFDCRNVPNVRILYGRTDELENLSQWIVADKCRFVTVLGMGGIGKTAPVAKLVEKVKSEFQYVMCRSLYKAPSIEKFLSDAINLFSNSKIKLPNTFDEKLTLLFNYLRSLRCLLVLDNVESIMQSGTYAGQCQIGYEGYADLIEWVAKSEHQSCLVLTTREKPKMMLQEGEKYSTRSLQLSGLEESAGQQFFTENDYFKFSEVAQKKIIQCYGGNPQALHIVLTDIQDWPTVDIFQWLKNIDENLLVFEDIEELLETQFERLSKPEKVVIYWLAINREPVSIFDLKADIVSPKIRRKVHGIVKSLRRRSLIEKVADGFTLQQIVMDYCTKRLIDKIMAHINQNRLAIFNRHALMKATAKDYVKETQIRLILQPIWNSLVNKMEPKGAENYLKQLLYKFQKKSPNKPGYLAGNILNLLCQNNVDLSGYNFSNLKIWQADLQNINLEHVDFAHSDFISSRISPHVRFKNQAL